MEIDFDSTDSVSDYVTIPAGTYLCRVAEVRQGTTRAGDDRWSVRLVVAEGQHVGKQAAWDNLVFSTRGRARVRLVMQALGLPASGKVQIEPQDLEERSAFVEIRPAEYQNAAGQMVRRNEVPYDGYRAVPAEGDTEDGSSAGSSAGSSQSGPAAGSSQSGPADDSSQSGGTKKGGKRSSPKGGETVNPDEIPF